MVEVTISLSNLLKQYFVVNSEDGKRIINSNGLVEERIRQLAVGARVPEEERLEFPGNAVEETSADFAEGIEAETVVEEPKPDPDEIARQILADAREKADQMLNDAHSQAKQLVADAEAEAQKLYEEQKQLGYAEGAGAKEQELEACRQQVVEDSNRREEEFKNRKAELEEEYMERQERMEADIVDALIPVFEKVFQIRFADQREILLALIRNVLMNVEVGSKLKIRVNEADAEMLTGHLDEIRKQVGENVSLEVMRDNKLTDGQCQLETTYGVFDCGIDTHFTNLIKDIRSLV